MKVFFMFILAVLTAPSFAADHAWTKATPHYTVYFEGGYATMPFDPPSSVPKHGAVITSIAYSWTPYDEQATNEYVMICYTRPYSTLREYCQQLKEKNGTLNTFKGLNAYGSFWIKHTLNGSVKTFPIYANGRTDTLTINYQTK